MRPGYETDEEFVRLGIGRPIDDEPRSAPGPSACCSITYASGSTGKPKGVVLTYANWHHVFVNMLVERRIATDDTLAFIGPLTHAGWSYLYAGLLRGARAAIFPAGDVEAMLGHAESEPVSIITCVPTTLSRIVALAGPDHPLLLAGRVSPKTIAQYTSEEALKHGVSREMQDDWAFASHEKYFAGQTLGLHDDVLFSPPGLAVPVLRDEGPREASDRARLAALPTVNGSATITAGNAPGLSDGAAGMVLMEGAAMHAAGVEPLAEILGWVQVAGDIQHGTSVPQVALLQLMRRHGLSLDQIALVEINEAFAATPLVSTRLLAEALGAAAARLQAMTNNFGGSVAIGHPLGASGVRIVMQAVSVLRRRGGGLALCAICGGFGQGEAVLVRV